MVPAAGPAVPGVGKYRYIATLDEGGRADVYLAVTKDTGFEKIVVIKQLRDTLAEAPSFVAMFMDDETKPRPAGKAAPRRWKAAPRSGWSKGGAPGGNLDTENPYQ